MEFLQKHPKDMLKGRILLKYAMVLFKYQINFDLKIQMGRTRKL